MNNSGTMQQTLPDSAVNSSLKHYVNIVSRVFTHPKHRNMLVFLQRVFECVFHNLLGHAYIYAHDSH